LLKAKRQKLRTEYSELYVYASSISSRMKEKLSPYID
jgi:hypothetical protein